MLHSLVKYWLFALPIPFLWADLATSSKVLEASGLLSFEEASVLTLSRSPRLESSRWNVRIKEASAIGAAALPNPELTLDVENAFGSSEFRDLDAAEKTLSLGQRIETAGKRRKRIDLANQGIEVANLEQGIEQFRVLNAMAKSYYETVAAQRSAAFSQESLEMQQRVSLAQQERLKAGKISEAEVESGKAALAVAEIEAEAARVKFDLARRQLAAHWGSSEPAFREVVASLDTVEPPDEESYLRDLQSSPFLEYASSVVEERDRSLNLERAKRISDITAGIGGRRFEATGDEALVFQVSVPIPLFDRNRGNIEIAQAEAAKARAERERAIMDLKFRISETYESLAAAHREAEAISQYVIPSAERGYNYANEGYLLGKYSYIELKAAQSVLLESRQKLIDAQLRFHKSFADLNTLLGHDL